MSRSSGLVSHGTGAPPELAGHESNPLLQQTMKPRHLQMIAVGGSIGTGLFVSYPPISTYLVQDRSLTSR
jgi:amino acid permease